MRMTEGGAGGQGLSLMRAECAGELEAENSFITRASAAGAVQARERHVETGNALKAHRKG